MILKPDKDILKKEKIMKLKSGTWYLKNSKSNTATCKRDITLRSTVFIQETQSWLKGWILINETILIKNSGKSYDHISGKSYHFNKCRKGFW